MAIIDPDEYVSRLEDMRANIFIDGEKVDRTDERLEPGINVIKETYKAPQDSELEDVCKTESHLTGEEINRFCRIHQSEEDLLKKQEMTRSLCHKVGGCIQRCMGIDAMNALSVVTYEMDEALGTNYYERFEDYLKYFQENDICANCAQTDAKGDRSKRPHEQEDPDLYLRIVEDREDGIIVRGAKLHNTIAPYADEIIATPTRFMTEEDNEYAVSFAVPADKEGVKLVVRPATQHERKELDAPIAEIGDAESFTIFDDVFIPKERVFMNGKANPEQTQYAGFLALLFANYHRHSYTGCKPAVSEILASASALIAEYNGIEGKSHVREKLSHLLGTAELVYASGESGSRRSEKTESGTMIPDEILVNAGRRLAGEEIYNEYKILADIAGALPATLPLEGDFNSDEVGDLLDKYMQRNPEVSTEDQHKAFRAIQDATVTDLAGVMQYAGLHGGGSPQMETITMMKRYDTDRLKKIAKYLSGIEEKFEKYERPTVTPKQILEIFRAD